MHTVVSIFSTLKKIKGFENSNVTLKSVVIALTKDAETPDIVAIADASECPDLIAELLVRHYKTMEANDLARLACKVSALLKPGMEYKYSGGLYHETPNGFYDLMDAVFSRSNGRTSPNPLLKKILESQYLTDPRTVEKVIRKSKSRKFTSELFALNVLSEAQLATFANEYIELRGKTRDLYFRSLENTSASRIQVLSDLMSRCDLCPANGVKLDRFNDAHLYSFIENEYAGIGQ